MAPHFCASRTTWGRSQPEMCIWVVYLRSARAKDPPMRPVPSMVTREMRCGDIESFQLSVVSSQFRVTNRRTNANAETPRAQRLAEKSETRIEKRRKARIGYASVDGKPQPFGFRN